MASQPHTKSIRISERTHAQLQRLSMQHRTSLDETILRLIANAERHDFWNSARDGYRALHEDREQYATHRAESDAWLDAPLTTLPDDDFNEYDDAHTPTR